jgi:hypothetical protein
MYTYELTRHGDDVAAHPLPCADFGASGALFLFAGKGLVAEAPVRGVDRLAPFEYLGSLVAAQCRKVGS